MVGEPSTGSSARLALRVVPGAKQTRIAGEYGDRLKICVNAPPEGGRANARLIQALAAWLDVAEARISIITGENTRDKVVAVQGLQGAEIQERLARVQERAPAKGRGG